MMLTAVTHRGDPREEADEKVHSFWARVNRKGHPNLEVPPVTTADESRFRKPTYPELRTRVVILMERLSLNGTDLDAKESW